MNKKTYRTKTIRETEIKDAPLFYKNIAGNQHYKRLGGGIDTNANMFKIEKVVDTRLPVTNGNGNITIFHGLGIRPFARGTYKILSAEDVMVGTNYPIGLRGQIPENRYPEFGTQTTHQVWVSASTENDIQINANIDSLEGTLAIRLILFREVTA